MRKEGKKGGKSKREKLCAETITWKKSGGTLGEALSSKNKRWNCIIEWSSVPGNRGEGGGKTEGFKTKKKRKKEEG